jgi:DNA topoisomerase-3
MILVIAEKPSVGQSIAAVLGAAERKDGYTEGNGYIVSWCFGHLAELAEAKTYDEKYAKWRQEDLPVLPDTWSVVVTKDKQKQFDLLSGLMKRSDITEIVCATDAGREGELIFRFVYDLAAAGKPFKRLWISSMEESAIRQGFDNLKDGREYDNLYASALCRAKADWLIGINATRLFSVLYRRTLNVGRVQTPTLALITERHKKISGFVKEPFFTVHIDAGGIRSVSEKISDKTEAEKLRAACNNKQAVCTSVTAEQKTVSPPKLFDLTSLQREANRIYGYTAKQSLDYLQTLYEKKLCTYPRTDSKYLTSDMEAAIPALALAARAALPFLPEDAGLPVNAAQLVNDKKVSDHHAVIPTAQIASFDLVALPEAERNILVMVCVRLLCAAGEKHVYETRTAAFECEGYTFTAKANAAVTEGFKAIERLYKSALKEKPDEDAEDESAELSEMPPLAEGQIFESVAAEITEGATQPPQPFTEDTLLSAMERAGAEETNDEAERKGLGTSATRAATIEKLVSSGFLTRRKKQLVPTPDGENLIAVLPESLKSPALTAEWENALTLIAKGEKDPDDFMLGIAEMTKALIRDNESVPEESKTLFAPDKEVIGKCPRCGGSVFEGKKNFYCENKDCKFVMWKNDRFWENRKKPLTKKIAGELLQDGKAAVKGLYSVKSGKTFDAVILLADTGDKYVNYRFEKKE